MNGERLADIQTVQPQKPAVPHRYAELDSLRGFAAVSVVLYHFENMWFGAVPFAGWKEIAWHVVAPFFTGFEAVMLFFLLSGFVLSVPYLKNKGDTYFIFIVRRILRIYGPYLAALALAIGGNAIWHGPLHLNVWANSTWLQPVSFATVLQHILFLGNFDFTQYNTAFWSLVIEMRISVIFPFLLFCILFLGRMKSLILALCLLYFGAILTYFYPDWWATLLTVSVAGIFIAGILLSKHIDAIGGWYPRLGAPWRVALAIASLFFYTKGRKFGLELPSYTATEMLFPAIGAAGLIILALYEPAASRVLRHSIPRFLGRISYSLYLVHGTVLFALTFAAQGKLSRGVQFPIYITTAILVATVFCILVEEPFMRLGRRVSRWSRTNRAAGQSDTTVLPVLASTPEPWINPRSTH